MKKVIVLWMAIFNVSSFAMGDHTLQLIVDLSHGPSGPNDLRSLEATVIRDMRLLQETFGDYDCTLERLRQRTLYPLSAHYVELNLFCPDPRSFAELVDFFNHDYRESPDYALPHLGRDFEVKVLGKRTTRPSIGAIRRN